MTKSSSLAASAIALLAAFPALAQNCEATQAPSPASTEETGIRFFNDTPFPMQVLWSDFEGNLVAVGEPVAPGGETGFNTYTGHAWYVDVAGETGLLCAGPISSFSPETCVMRILYAEGVGMDGGYCDY